MITVQKSCFRSIDKFFLVVPENYNHTTHIDEFKTRCQKKFYHYHPGLVSANFARATTVLTPGQKLEVEVFEILSKVSSEECLEKICAEKGILTGAHGATLVFEQEKRRLLKGKINLFFDEKEALRRGSDRFSVPILRMFFDGDFAFDLHGWGIVWSDAHCIFVFRNCN